MDIFLPVSLFLTFTFTNGTVRSFPSESLSMTIESDRLVIDSPQSGASFLLSDLESMEFTSEEFTDIAEAVTSVSVSVYSLKGELFGEFESADEAEKSLAAGVYVFKTKDSTFKRIIE